MFDSLDSLLHIPSVTALIDSILIVAGCSPVGNEDYNHRLAERRALSMRTYLRWKHLEIAQAHPIVMTPIGIDYAGYRALKSGDSQLSEREIWQLLQYTTVRLRMKDGSYIYKGADSPVEAVVESGGLPALEAVNNAGDTLVADRAEMSDEREAPATDTAFLPQNNGGGFRFYVSSNLLYDALLLPNLAIEIPFAGGRWSARAYGYWAWWPSDAQRWSSYRVQWAGVSLRRWMGDRFFAGAYVSGGDYALRLFPSNEDSMGYMSLRSWSAGVEGGYSLPIASRLNLELMLGLGWFGGTQYKYNRSRCANCYPWRGTKQVNYFGPTKAAVSLVYRIGE